MTTEANPSAEDDITNIVCETVSKPSRTLCMHETTLSLEDIPVGVTLITMERSLLLVIHDCDSSPNFKFAGINEHAANEHTIRDMMIQGFMESNKALRGLALGIGDHSTCIISSDNALSSATLASRISKKLNQNRPVYVANNLQQSQHILDSDMVMAKFYMRVFQFVRSKYCSNEQKTQQKSTKDDGHASDMVT